MKDKIKIALVGLGRRGMGMLTNCFVRMSDVEIAIICDLIEERLERASAVFTENGKPEPRATTRYSDVLSDPEIDAVVIMTGWDSRPEMAKQSMQAGKYTAIEVGCAKTLDECYDLIRVYEETGVPLMMLENCCYGRREMMALNIARQGLFGEIVHCTGEYSHYLNRVELFAEMFEDGAEPRQVEHYRLAHYIEGNRENYPTHELGPISKVLGINRGNRFLRLSSFASKSAGLRTFARDNFGEDSEYAAIDYRQGDIVNTILTCAGGETVLLTLDTTIPVACYSRNFAVRGTRGLVSEARRAIVVEGVDPAVNNESDLLARFDHPLHAEYSALGSRGDHGGMDWLVCRAFIEAVKSGTNTPIDAYDTVTWLAVGALSEMSIQSGGAPVDFPDFTSGRWQKREPITRGKYCLDEVCEDRATPIFVD